VAEVRAILPGMRRLLVLFTVSASVLVACGGSSTAPTTAITDAPPKTANAGTAKLEVTVVSATTNSAPTTTAKAGKAASTTTTTAPAGPTKVTSAVDFKTTKGRFEISAASLGLPAGSGPLQAVLIGQVFYFKGLGGLSLPGKPWIKIDLSKLSGAGGVAGQLQSLDPNSYLVQLKGVTGAVKKIGKEKVRGESTTHYAFTVDLDKAARLAPAEQRAGIEAAAKTVANKTVPTELWLDGAGRVRRFKQKVLITSGLATGTTDLTIEYFDFGTKVEVVAPPADQTADFTQLLSSLGNS